MIRPQPNTEPGFHALELGDTVFDPYEDEARAWGAVVQAGRDLVILWANERWEMADVFEASMVQNDTPYQIKRTEWDLDARPEEAVA